MAKKKDKPKKIEVKEEVKEVATGGEEVTCPVCGKPVGLDVPSCPHCGAEFEEEDTGVEESPEEAEIGGFVSPAKPAASVQPSAPVTPAGPEEETAECPVCGKSVGLSAAACPFCGAEFEEEVEEVTEEAAKPVQEQAAPVIAAPSVSSVSEGEKADCPVCGKSVSLDVTACPFCGAEFEEEEVEEVIEVEEQATPAVAEEAEREPGVEFVSRDAVPEVETEIDEGTAYETSGPLIRPKDILDLRVIGISLIILGIIGSQISTMIDWYWTWVPPIQSNLPMFILLAAAVIIVGLVVFVVVKKALYKGRELPSMMPSIAMSLFLFGIFALVMIVLYNPINSALQSSKIGVAGAFLGLLVVGVLAVFMGQRMTSRSPA